MKLDDRSYAKNHGNLGFSSVDSLAISAEFSCVSIRLS
ncbi:hypothetical protein MRBBS_3120 [Marinobacter sp. BSs20148]|nr:hypothetical protein MRBBS_3120 [Marinobacter sp. BSs20148]